MEKENPPSQISDDSPLLPTDHLKPAANHGPVPTDHGTPTTETNPTAPEPEFLPIEFDSQPEPEEPPAHAYIPPPPTLCELISPSVGTPEYEARPLRIREAYTKAVQEGEPIPDIETVEQAEEVAIRIARTYRKNRGMLLLVADVLKFIDMKTHAEYWNYKEPYERAPDYVPLDTSERDPVSLSRYLRRCRIKLGRGISQELERVVYDCKDANPDRVRTLLALAAAVKYTRQSGPKQKQRGRPAATGARAQREMQTATGGGPGGARTGAGRKRLNDWEKKKRRREREASKKAASDDGSRSASGG